MNPEYLSRWVHDHQKALRDEAEHRHLLRHLPARASLRSRVARVLHRLADALEPRVPRPQLEPCETC